MPDRGEVVPFSARVAGGKPADGAPSEENGELVVAGGLYATAVGGRVALCLEFIRRDGRAFSVPYSYLPLTWWEPPGTLIVEYPGVFSVLLHGRDLEELHRRIRDHRVTWLREFDARRVADLPGAVTRLAILRSFPSREGDD